MLSVPIALPPARNNTGAIIISQTKKYISRLINFVGAEQSYKLKQTEVTTNNLDIKSYVCCYIITSSFKNSFICFGC